MNEKEKFQCSRCGLSKERHEFHEFQTDDRKRSVTSQCKDCRSDTYFSKKYSTLCIQCGRPRLLDKNHICAKCNEESGLRQCKICGELLPTFLFYYSTRRRCKQCGKKLRKRNKDIDTLKEILG